MIQILRNTTGNIGWRLGTSGQVYQGGRLRHDNGQWEVDDELDDPSDAIDYLDDGDFEALTNALDAIEAEEERLAAAATARGQLSAAELDSFVEDLYKGPSGRILRWGKKRFTKDDRSGRVCVVFRKHGGYRDWLFPVDREEVRGLINGTHEVRYTIGGNNAKIVKK